MKPSADIAALTVDIAPASRASSRLNDFYELTKPRMNLLVIITTMVGFCMASKGSIDWLLMLHTVLGTALTAASAAVLNQLMERRHDAKMPRTADRPIVTGRISPMEALAYGCTIGIAGVTYLALAVNILTACLGLATLLIYLLIYTPLKRITSLNTVIGAVPGAIPPVMGFTAVDGALSIQAVTVFGILFIWQMPHFLAIAIMYKQDYQAGGFKMLPCIDVDLHLTGRMILLYAAALLPVSLLPAILGMAGAVYYVAAVILGMGFLSYASACVKTHSRSDAKQLFFASIIYLPLVLGVMLFDKL